MPAPSRSRRTAAAFLLAFATALLLAAPAPAATITSHEFSSSFDGSSTPDGSLGIPSGIDNSLAINQHNGKVYVVDADHSVINVFTAAGALESQIKGEDVPQGKLDLDDGSGGNVAIAIDDSGGATQGRVYVAISDLGSIFAFSPTGAYLFQFDLGIGSEFFGDVAVDGSGNVWVSKLGGEGSETVYKLNSSGTLLQKIPLSSYVQPMQTHHGAPAGLGFGAGGDLYIVDTQFSRVFRLDPALALVGLFDSESGNFYRASDVDAKADRVYVAHHNRIAVFDPAGNFVDEFGFAEIGDDATRALAVNQATNTVYVANAKTDEVFVFAPVSVTAPDVTLSAATDITDASATLNATVDPAGHPTTYHLDYRKRGTAAWNVGPTESAGSGSGAVPVSRPIAGLDFGTIYEIRVQAQSTDTAKRDAAQSTFRTAAHAPEAEAAPAGPRATTTARLNARVDPNGAATSYHFEYGPDASYGSTVPASLDADAGSERGVVLVSQEIAGLSPETTYHYRVVAENEIGEATSEDLTFTTRDAAEVAAPTRGIELVSSPDKSGQAVAQATLARDRDRALWVTTGGTPLSTSGGATTFIADRTPSGWVSRSAVPPLEQQFGGGQLSYDFFHATPGFGAFLAEAEAGAVSSRTEQIFLSLDDNAQQSFLADNSSGGSGIFDVDDDLGHIYMWSHEPSLPGNVIGPKGPSNVYEVAGGTPVLVGRLPDGSVPTCGVEFAPSRTFHHWVSTDPGADPRAYFTSAGFISEVTDECTDPMQLYVRDLEAETTTLVSGPPVAGELKSAFFAAASSNGRIAIFATATQLDPADTDEFEDIYRYEEGAGLTCLTCDVAGLQDFISINQGVAGGIVVSKDFSRIYLTSASPLLPGLGPRAGVRGIYVLHEGQLRFVAPTHDGLLHLGDAVSPAPDGHVLIFGSSENGITADQRGQVKQYYRYDDRDGSVECITCPPAEQKDPGGLRGAGADVPLGGAAGRGLYSPSGLSADGETAAFVSAVSFVQKDVNRSYDIYEWHNGTLTMITDGVSEYAGDGLLKPQIRGISADGTNLLFWVGARLTGHELDHANQLYAARIGGGFAPPPLPPAPCGEDCQGPLQPPPPLSSPPATADFRGAGNRAVVRKRKHKRGHKRKHGKRRHKQSSHGRGGKR